MTKEEILEELKGHLELLEKLTGVPLRTEPLWPDSYDLCPLVQFGPERDTTGKINVGSHIYENPNDSWDFNYYDLHDNAAQDRWIDILDSDTQQYIYTEICKWVKERSPGVPNA